MSDDLCAEARELYAKVTPLFEGHSAFACMVVLAYLFAQWMDMHEEREHASLVRMFHRTAMDAYGDLQKAQGEQLH